MTEVAIDIRDVSLAFGDVQALERMTLAVVFGFLGPNGPGKTSGSRSWWPRWAWSARLPGFAASACCSGADPGHISRSRSVIRA